MRHNVLICLVVATVFGSRAPAQILKLSGEVTTVFGVYSNLFSAGDPVTFSLDLSPPLIDELQGAGLRHQTVLYSVPATLLIGTTEMFLLSGKTDPFFLRKPTQNGIYINSAWEEFGDTPGGEVFQEFDSEHSILPSYTYFPPNISMEEFLPAIGTYANRYFDPTGSVEWMITSYTGFGGSPPSLTPVPEPSIFAVAGIGLLGLVVFFRSRSPLTRGACPRGEGVNC
jgi:hypothetical protein